MEKGGKMAEQKEIITFNSNNGEVQLNTDFEHDTIWAIREQIASLFDIDRTGVNRHIRNIYKAEELDEKVTYAKIAQVQIEGTRQVSRKLDYFNLDMILSVGYRVNSKKTTEFRKWANGVLKQYISKGYAINEKRLTDLNLVFQILERSEITELSGAFNLVSEYTQALFLRRNLVSGRI